MLKRAASIALIALVVAAAASARSVDKVVFKKAAITAKATGANSIDIHVTVTCSGAKHFSAHVWLASTEGSNQSFWDQTTTGDVKKNKGESDIAYKGAIPAPGFVVAGSNVFCWDKDKSQGVGYRDLFFAQCAPRGRCTATASPRKF